MTIDGDNISEEPQVPDEGVEGENKVATEIKRLLTYAWSRYNNLIPSIKMRQYYFFSSILESHQEEGLSESKAILEELIVEMQDGQNYEEETLKKLLDNLKLEDNSEESVNLLYYAKFSADLRTSIKEFGLENEVGELSRIQEMTGWTEQDIDQLNSYLEKVENIAQRLKDNYDLKALLGVDFSVKLEDE